MKLLKEYKELFEDIHTNLKKLKARFPLLIQKLPENFTSFLDKLYIHFPIFIKECVFRHSIKELKLLVELERSRVKQKVQENEKQQLEHDKKVNSLKKDHTNRLN